MKKIHLLLLLLGTVLTLSAGKITVVLLLEPQNPGKVETEKTAAQKSQMLVKKTSNVPLAKEGAKD